MTYRYYIATANFDMEAIINSSYTISVEYSKDVGPVYDNGKHIGFEEQEYATITTNVCCDHWFC